MLNIDFSQYSFHFLSKPIKTKRLGIKIAWILILLTFFTLNVYYVVLNIIDFLNFETTTSIYEIDENSAEFPTISFCVCESKYNISILYTSFNNDNTLEDDWENHFEMYKDTSYGKCYRFNSGKNMFNQTIPIKYSKSSGFDDGLELRFYSKTDDDFGSLKILIHNHSQTPATIYNKGFSVSAGTYNYFILNRNLIQRLEQPYNDCYKNLSQFKLNKTIINYMLNKMNWIYTQSECIRLCKNLKFTEMNDCDCTLKSIEEDISSECMTSNKTKISKNCSRQFMANFNPIEKCKQYCPLECESFYYQINTYTRLIDAGNLSIISKDSSFVYQSFKTYANVSKTFYSINVYYEDLKYTLISQKPKIELFGLISNIGGLFSLFLGFSLGSFLELFEILIEFILQKN
jgi:hypothetical protein